MIVFTGNGKSGSWKIRGIQLGSAVGSDVSPQCLNYGHADLVVYIKRRIPRVMDALHKSGKPIVWDVVDAWPQPVGNYWTKDQAVNWLAEEIKAVKPRAIVFPTTAMLEDSQWKGPHLVLPHHSWQRYHKAPDNRSPITVGYEGGAHYLGAWRGRVEAQCKKRGWRFVVNGSLEPADIGVALREQNGYPARHWKSNVKLANIQAIGVPAICSPEKGYLEFGSGEELYVTEQQDLENAFDALENERERRRIGTQMYHFRPQLAQVAMRYRRWLEQLNF